MAFCKNRPAICNDQDSTASRKRHGHYINRKRRRARGHELKPNVFQDAWEIFSFNRTAVRVRNGPPTGRNDKRPSGQPAWRGIDGPAPRTDERSKRPRIKTIDVF
jgi:hypothetical protein